LDLRQEAGEVEITRNSAGWQILKEDIQEEFDKEYKKLRRSLKDSAFYKTQGKLDALEFVLELPETIINRGEL
jgi:hypothetical protein